MTLKNPTNFSHSNCTAIPGRNLKYTKKKIQERKFKIHWTKKSNYFSSRKTLLYSSHRHSNASERSLLCNESLASASNLSQSREKKILSGILGQETSIFFLLMIPRISLKTKEWKGRKSKREARQALVWSSLVPQLSLIPPCHVLVMLLAPAWFCSWIGLLQKPDEMEPGNCQTAVSWSPSS